MAPTPEEHGSMQSVEMKAPTHRVVISGMAGLFPKARYVSDLENILYNKLNPVTSEDLRWQYNHPEAAQYTGNVPELDRFDAQFFKVHYRLGNSMDSMSRKILEQAYAAIYDAGISPTELSGKKVGVYIGSCMSETEKASFYIATSRTGFGIAGCNKSMFANRISYWLNAKGPSMAIDEACCSSTGALEQAYRAISRGECEAAIVGGANLSLHPQSSVHYGRIMKMSTDGKTKSFAQDAAGCAKSEAINVLFLQQAKHAKRIYADVVYVKSEFMEIPRDETGPKYGFYRNPDTTAIFLKKFYDDAGVLPNSVEYVEAFGSAVPDADKSELEAIDKVFCNDREKPLLVGSVMSNIGYGEAASGISAVTKVLLGYHKGEMAGNLHCDIPRQDVAAIQEGRIRILTDNEQIQRSYAAVNSLSVTGLNAHVLLRAHNKPKDLNRYKTDIPRLVTISARQDSSVNKVLEYLKSHPIDPEELSLLHNIHETSIAGHLGRGFTILDADKNNKTVSLSEKAEYFDDSQRPLWFVYSGMGSQWAGMGAQLMRIPIFAAAIERCRQALEPKGIDIVHIITSNDKSIFDNILHSFVGIAAVQIGLTDVLLKLGLVPDKIIGHSVGELGCAYADGCLTAEEMILAAYSRGLVSLETPFIRGSMAAIGIGYQRMSKMCPPEIEIACHNSADSCTISGPADVMRSFVSDLTNKGIFAKEVPCSNIAYHSRYIADAGPGLLKYLKEVIPIPKTRSERWVSTSVPKDKWEESAAKYSSAEYHTNNLLSPVLFEETSELIPSNAVLVEVAPHGLLQAILKRSLPTSCINIPLTRRAHHDNVFLLLEAVGKLYMNGFNPKVQVLYPQIEFPVSNGTPLLSQLVEWAHQEKWPLPLYQSARRTVASSRSVLISLYDEEHEFLKGHVIREKTLVPFSFALVATWDTLAMTMNVPKKSINVKFCDVKLYTQPILNEQKIVRLSISINRGNGWFEIVNENSKVATGFITSFQKRSKVAVLPKGSNEKEIKEPQMLKEELTYNGTDVYRLLYERQYAYSGAFRSIHSANESLNEANILWEDNWVTFLDGLFQVNTLRHTYYNNVSQIDHIGNIIIDVDKHMKIIEANRNTHTVLRAQVLDVYNRTWCEGVEIENIQFHDLPPVPNPVSMHTLKFVPRYCSEFDVHTSLKIFLQMTAENINKDKINVVGLSFEHNKTNIFEEIENISLEGEIPDIDVEYRHIPKDIALQENTNLFNNVDLIIMKNLSNSDKICQNFYQKLQPNTFIVSEEEVSYRATRIRPSNLYNVVSVLKNLKSQLELALWRPTATSTMTSAFTARSESDLPLLTNARNTLSTESGLIVVTSYPPVPGLLSLVKRWRREPTRNRIHLIMVNEKSKENARLDELPDVNLAYNIFNDGSWGGEYILPVRENTSNSGNVTLQSDNIGNLDTLRWVPAPELIDSRTTLVTVHYAGINVGDVKRALGVTNRKENFNSYGMEFSGVTESGERVMGLVSKGAASSEVIAQPDLLWPVPSFWTLEDAATVPFAYIYAYYCLLKTSTLASNVNKSVLVHGGSGALGQAVISIALARGYRVFTTVSDLHKKRFLRRLYPELKDEYIGNSRDSTFVDLVLNSTNGEGCNLVVCCLNKDLKDLSFKCGKVSSLICDTTQILNHDNYYFGMSNLSREKSYLAVNIMDVLQNGEEVKILHSIISDGIVRGEVRPLSRVSYSPHEAARAFRLLAASRHRGRVLLRPRDTMPPPRHRVPSTTSHSHVVICDEQPLGLQLTEKLIVSGAKRIHLHFLKPPSHLHYKLRAWEKLQTLVTISHGKLDDMKDVICMFNKATSLGTVEGLYVVADNVIQPVILNHLNLAIGQFSPALKHFLILSGDDSVIQRTKGLTRVNVLDLSRLPCRKEDGLIWYNGASEAAIRALQCPEAVMIAQPSTSPRLSLVQQVAAIAELNINANTPNTSSLRELGMVLEKTAAIAAFLRDMHNTYLDDDAIPSLTLDKINEIENHITESNYEETKGLETFYSYVDSDELLATTEIVHLPTLTNNSTMRDDEFNVNDTCLYIVPGLEGHHARFSQLCERLKMSALVLQPGLDRPNDTPRELALRYAEVLIKKIGLPKSDKPFYILGYEVGLIVALELASILEEHGQSGTVFCIGDGPEEIRDILKEELSGFKTEEELQSGVIRHMFTLMAEGAAVPESVLECGTWSARVDACVRALLGRVSHSAQYARSLLQAAYDRISTARSHIPSPIKLRSRIVLLRARRTTSNVEHSLQLYSEQPIHVQNLTAPMAHAAVDLQAPAIINSYLDRSLLEAFDKRNLCDSYLMNADAFLGSTDD